MIKKSEDGSVQFLVRLPAVNVARLATLVWVEGLGWVRERRKGGRGGSELTHAAKHALWVIEQHIKGRRLELPNE